MNGGEGKYLGYSVEDFVWDEAFRAWVNSPGKEDEAFWKEWLFRNPGKVAIVESARQIIIALVPPTHHIAPAEIDFQIDQIFSRRDAGDVPEETASVYRLNIPAFLKIAAVFLLVAGLAFLFVTNRAKHRGLDTIATASGIQKKVMLSDSSMVMLNSNSKISFKKSWAPSETREIWMEGEGFFEVKHLDKDRRISNHERFLVHVNGVTVEVLGTVFNIRNRRGKTEVVLKEGSVKLSFDDHRQKDILMVPEEIVTINAGSLNPVSVSKVKPEDYAAWTHQKMILKDTHLDAIIQYLEDNYGKKIILSDSAMLNKRIDGTLMLDNLDDALFVLSKVLKAKVQQNDTSIYFIKM